MLSELKWESVPNDLMLEFARKILPHIEEQACVRAFAARLPFYPDAYRIYRMETSCYDTEKVSGRTEEWFALWNGAGFPLLINGESGVVHETNEVAPLALTPQNTADYLRFFLFCVRGENGAFILLEKQPEKNVPGAEAVAALTCPLTYIEQDEDGRARYKATVAYAGNLYLAYFAVSQDGIVAMTDDELLVTDVPAEAIPSIRELTDPRITLMYFPIPAATAAIEPGEWEFTNM